MIVYVYATEVYHRQVTIEVEVEDLPEDVDAALEILYQKTLGQYKVTASQKQTLADCVIDDYARLGLDI